MALSQPVPLMSVLAGAQEVAPPSLQGLSADNQ